MRQPILRKQGLVYLHRAMSLAGFPILRSSSTLPPPPIWMEGWGRQILLPPGDRELDAHTGSCWLLSLFRDAGEMSPGGVSEGANRG